MFNNKRITELERKVKDLEDAMRRMQNYLLACQNAGPIIEFVPDPEMNAEIRKKMN